MSQPISEHSEETRFSRSEVLILILRGWGSDYKNWQEEIEFLENQGYRIYSPDLPGFGENPSPSKPWSIDEYANWVKEFCEKQNLSRFFLLGHSFGGAVAIKFLLKHFQEFKVEKLILVDSSGVRRKTLKKEILKKISGFAKKFFYSPIFNLHRKIFYKLFIRSDYPDTEGVMRETYLKIINEDLSDYLSRISLPTLIIWGKKDKLTPVKDAYLMKEKIIGASLEIIPDIGHNPHREAPEILKDKVLNFLKQ